MSTATPPPPTPDIVLAELKLKLGNRAHANLDIVHDVCRSIHKQSGKDYSLVTVGRKLAALHKGPSYNTLQAPSGRHFKTLISAWADHSGASMVKQAKPSPPPSSDDALLRKIEEPALRSEIGFRLAQGRRDRAELNTLKGVTVLTVDMRPTDGLAHAQGNSPQIVDAAPRLLESERSALTTALDDSRLRRLGITIGEDGEFLLNGKVLFDVGFASGLQKLIDSHR